jgi:hypothetical protein
VILGARGQERRRYLRDFFDAFGFVVKLQKHSRMKNGFGRFIAHRRPHQPTPPIVTASRISARVFHAVIHMRHRRRGRFVTRRGVRAGQARTRFDRDQFRTPYATLCTAPPKPKDHPALGGVSRNQAYDRRAFAPTALYASAG